jgi:hypothetical protein
MDASYDSALLLTTAKPLWIGFGDLYVHAKPCFDCENVCLRPSRHAALEGLDCLKQTARCYPKRLGARSSSCAFWSKGQRSRLDAQLVLRAPDCAFSQASARQFRRVKALERSVP